MWTSPLALFSVVSILGVNGQVVQNGKCCRDDIDLSVPPAQQPYFKGFCWKTGTFGKSGTQYQCGDYGWVMYRPGIEEKHTGVTHDAQFELKRAQGGPGYVHVILRCAPEENPGLAKSFNVEGHPFYCASTVGQTFAGLKSCKHPRISYRLAPPQDRIQCL